MSTPIKLCTKHPWKLKLQLLQYTNYLCWRNGKQWKQSPYWSHRGPNHALIPSCKWREGVCAYLGQSMCVAGAHRKAVARVRSVAMTTAYLPPDSVTTTPLWRKGFGKREDQYALQLIGNFETFLSQLVGFQSLSIFVWENNMICVWNVWLIIYQLWLVLWNFFLDKYNFSLF